MAPRSSPPKRKKTTTTRKQARVAEAKLRQAALGLERAAALTDMDREADPHHWRMHSAGLAILEAVALGLFPSLPELSGLVPPQRHRSAPVGLAEIRCVPFQAWKVLTDRMEQSLSEHGQDPLAHEAVDDYLSQRPWPELPFMGRAGYLKARLVCRLLADLIARDYPSTLRGPSGVAMEKPLRGWVRLEDLARHHSLTRREREALSKRLQYSRKTGGRFKEQQVPYTMADGEESTRTRYKYPADLAARFIREIRGRR